MARGFNCVNCGTGSLVRSNFKLTPDHRPYCRDEDGCEERRKKWPHTSQYDHHVWLYNSLTLGQNEKCGWDGCPGNRTCPMNQVCCCGEYINHSGWEGHSPVPAHDYYCDEVR